MKTIELNCPPGSPRPSDLIGGVIAGTGLALKEPDLKFFGNFTYSWDVPEAEWEKIQEITRPRIEALYHAGVIRYGSW